MTTPQLIDPAEDARRRSAEEHARLPRAVQALVGILAMAAGAGAFDWRYGLITFGALTLATSAVWRTTA